MGIIRRLTTDDGRQVSSVVCRPSSRRYRRFRPVQIGLSLHADGVQGSHGQSVSALVEFVPGVTAHPRPGEAVRLHRGMERLPQIAILDGLFVAGAPAVAHPAREPLRHAPLHVFGIGVNLDRARSGERLKRGERGAQLHAVVGRQRRTALQHLLVRAEAQDRAPTAGAGIAGARAVGVDNDSG